MIYKNEFEDTLTRCTVNTDLSIKLIEMKKYKNEYLF